MRAVLILVLLALVCVNAWSPTNSYKPGKVKCPDKGSLVRKADKMNEDELKWIPERQKNARQPLIDYLRRANMSDFDPQDFLADNKTRIPNIALAFSGGGYRAMLAGAGEMAALDKRTNNATTEGHIGGILQAATYMSGLSGGNWLVGSVVLNNFSSVEKLQASEDVWDLEHSIINPGGLNIFHTAHYWDKLKDDVEGKGDDFNTSITDIWGRGLSQQFIGLDRGGPALTWDDIQNFPVFKDHKMPFPIVVADGREPGTKILSTNSTVFEVTPYELGTWDPAIYAFTEIKYLGTEVDKGKPKNKDKCIAGFDNAGYIMGTSSSLFNQFILQLNTTGVSGVVYDLAEKLLKKIGDKNDDIAIYSPNPFKGTEYGNSTVKDAEWLTLVDGGEDGQNIPIYPFIQPERKVDVLFAFDNSADTDYSWPNGTALAATYERQFNIESNNTFFPYVPDSNTFINEGLTERPTFFGCNASNLTTLYPDDLDSDDYYVPPLIVYIANFAHSYFSNTSTFKLSYDDEEVHKMINNGYHVTTRENSTLDEEWPACLGCAIIQREVERRGQEPTEQCRRCFERYCWDGAVADHSVNKTSNEFAPTLTIDKASNLTPSLLVLSALFTASLLI
jgi:lysophospholipase